MAEECPRPASKYRGKAMPLLGKAGVADGVDPAVEAMQASGLYRPGYRIPRVRQWTDQLTNRDDAVLPSRQLREPLMRTPLPFVAHTAIKGNSAALSPPGASLKPLRPAAAG
jgi:hypothetical protein